MPGHNWSAPYYLGLEDGHTGDGRWHGSVSFYESDDQAEDGDGVDVDVDVVQAWSDPQHPHEWAAQIAEHYRARTLRHGPRT